MLIVYEVELLIIKSKNGFGKLTIKFHCRENACKTKVLLFRLRLVEDVKCVMVRLRTQKS